MRTAAWVGVVGGAATPVLRRKLKLRAPLVAAISATSPLGLAVALPRSRKRDALIYALQMWAYIAAYEMPNDDPDKLMDRVRINYPIWCDKVLGLGKLPTERLQPSSNPGHLRKIDFVLTWAHWLWYLFPHSSVVYTLVRKREHFPRTVVMIAATFDLGAIVYWLVPTAPPWWAAKLGRIEPVRRIMVEVGERTWGRAWQPMYEFLGGNPVAAMPSLHFASSAMAAHMLAETGPVAGIYGWTYALTLGYGLVYLGEHYVTDLLVGLALTETIRRYGPIAAPALERIAATVQALEARART